MAFGHQLVSFSLVATVRSLQLLRIDDGFGNTYCARRLEPTDDEAIVGGHQPEQCRHRPAVVEDGSIADHTRRPVVVADNDLEFASRLAAKKFCNPSPIGCVSRDDRAQIVRGRQSSVAAPQQPTQNEQQHGHNPNDRKRSFEDRCARCVQ